MNQEVPDAYLYEFQEHPMGEARKDALRVNFDTQVKLQFLGAKITSDAGLLPYRELDELLGLTVLAAGRLIDSRTGMNTQYSTTALLHRSVYSRLAAYDDSQGMRRTGGGRDVTHPTDLQH